MSTHTSAGFATTRWSVILAASIEGHEDSTRALDQLCATYWPPLYGYLRRQGHSPADAEDLTQAFFARLLSKGDLRQFEPAQGRFRCWLLGCLRHFLANQRDREQARKRGGDCHILPLEQISAVEERFLGERSNACSADQAFDRSWALAVLESARRNLREEYVRRGWTERFELFEPFLPGEESDLTQKQVGGRLGLSEGAVKSEVYRLKRRLGELIRAEIRSTVDDPSQVEAELQSLKAALVE